MNRKFKIWLMSIVIIAVGLNLFMFLYIHIIQYYTKRLFREVQNHDKLYVYETYFGALNAPFYVEDIKDTGALVTYYQRVIKHDTATNYINFPLKMNMTLYEPIYVYKHFGKGSNIVQLVDFNKKCWGYFKGYYYIPTTHAAPPTDSLVKKEEAFIIKYNSDKDVQIRNRISADPDKVYGWYCGD
ncbi:MAG TPA: hypothetical protein VFE53_20740 [Mucilaginibacter sp.]|nr:hypothetical protein [Mucilaginibacter sp.]